MDFQTYITTIQHINWAKVLHNYHARHYIWEVSKVLIPVLLTGMITFTAMKIADSKNKKRWLNDGHIKRKTELEIELRKFLLGIKAIISYEYETLVEWENDTRNLDLFTVEQFNKNFESLVEYLQNEENQSENENYRYKKIFALIDEYVYYQPKTKKLFEEFKALYNKIFELKTVYKNGSSDILEEIKLRPKHFDEMINVYLCFITATESILKKLTVKKL